MQEETLRILKMLEEGKITASEAERLLQALTGKTSKQLLTPEKPFRPKDFHHWPWKYGTHPGRVVAEVMKSVNPGKIVAEVMEGIRESGLTSDFRWNKCSHQEEEKITIPREEIKEITLNNLRGDIEIRGTEGEEIVIVAEKTAWGEDEEEATSRTKGISIETEKEGENLRIKVEAGPWIKKRHAEIDFQLSIPRDLNLIISATNGDIKAYNLCNKSNLSAVSGDILLENSSGDFELSSVNGEIEVQNVSGQELKASTVNGDLEIKDTKSKILLKTMSGNAEIKQTEGRIEINSMSGDIEIRDSQGDLSLITQSGDITLEDIDGALQVDSVSGDLEMKNLQTGLLKASTTSGDISASLTLKEKGECQIRTTSGDIELEIPEETKATIEAKTQSGTLDLAELENLQKQTELGKTRISGIINAPEGKILLASISGDISVETL
ncbi:MAG: DUF4097 family beta strand repeat-containing protein [Candidatus Edwardsbacteria bacterium]